MACSIVNNQLDDYPSLDQVTTLTESNQQTTSPSAMDSHDISANGRSGEVTAAVSTGIHDLTPNTSDSNNRQGHVRMKIFKIMSLSRSRSRSRSRRSTEPSHTFTQTQHSRAGLSFSSSRHSHFSFSSESSISVRSSEGLSLEKFKSLFRPHKFKQNGGSTNQPSRIVGQSDVRGIEVSHHGFQSIRYETTTPAASPVSKPKRGTSIKNLFRLRSSKKTNAEPRLEDRRIAAPFQRPPRPQRPEDHLCPDPVQYKTPKQRSLSRRSGLVAATRLDGVPEEADEEERPRKRWSGGSKNPAPLRICTDGRYPSHGALQRATTPPSINTQTNDALRKKARRKIRTTSPELLAYINGVGDQFLDSRTAEYALAPSPPATVSVQATEPRAMPYRLQERPFHHGETSRTAAERHARRISRASQHDPNNGINSSVESLTSSARIEDAMAVLVSRARNMHANAAQRLHHALVEAVNREEINAVYPSARPRPLEEPAHVQEEAVLVLASNNVDIDSGRRSVYSTEFPEEEINRVYDEIFGPTTQRQI